MSPSWIDRVLRVFGDVKPKEGARLLLLGANLLLLLFAYYLLKTLREPLILTSDGGGAEVKSYAGAAQAVLLVGVASLFGWLASRVRRMTLFATVSAFFASNLVVFHLLFRSLPDHKLALGIAFFIWVGCFNVMIIAQFWAFANDLYTKEQGERLFGVIAGGSAIGAILGAKAAKPLYKLLGPYPLMLVAAVLVLACIGLTYAALRMSVAKGEAQAEHAGEGYDDSKLDAKSGFSLMLHDRYLMLVALLSFAKNWVNTTGEYILDRRLLEGVTAKVGTDEHARAAYVAAFKSDYFTYVNIAVLVLQLVAVSRIVRYIGVRRALFVLPIIALSGYGTMAFVPVLSVIFVVKIVENSTDYSLQKTAEQMLFLVTSRDAKYKVKAITDTFAVRLGDVMSGALVWVGSKLSFTTTHFIVANIGLVCGWLGVVIFLARAHAKRSDEKQATEPASNHAAQSRLALHALPAAT